jgi:uncharacterized membrane protein
MNNDKGNAMVLVVISILVLLGCVAVAVDAGYLYSERASLVTAADAAALAGAGRLLDSDNPAIEDMAIEIAKANIFEDGTEKITVDIDKANHDVRVTVAQKKGLFLSGTACMRGC